MRNDHLKKVGFWRSHFEPNLPMPVESGEKVAQYRGWSDCRVCGKMNGSSELSDGTYIWPSGLVHYVRDHNTGLPLEFFKHVVGLS